MMRIAVLASHGGTVLQAIMDACASGEIGAQVALVLSNNSGARALARARADGIDAMHLSAQTHTDSEALDLAMVAALEAAQVDWVVLAGYMKKLGPKMLTAYRDRILNTHPALLPKFGGEGFYGRRVHQAVLDAGETESGATVHLVEGDYDTGPILAQVRVPVHADDTVEALEERVKVAERRLIITTLAELSTRKAAAGY